MKEKIDTIYSFGEDVIVKARDITIEQQINTIAGNAKAPFRVELCNKLRSFSNEQRDLLKILLVDAIDCAINNFLWMMEENNDKYAFVAGNKAENQFDIEQESDGLCVGQWEFIEEYSKYNTADEFLSTGKLEKE